MWTTPYDKKQLFWLLNPLSYYIRYHIHTMSICCQKDNRLVFVPFAANYVFRIMEITFFSGYFLIFFQFQHQLSIWPYCSVFSIWCMWLHVHTPAHTPLVWCVLKIACVTSVYDTYCLGHWNEESHGKNKNIKLNSWSFFFNFFNLNVEKSKFGVNTIISLAYIKYSELFLLEPWQNSLNNLEAYSEPCQTSKMESFSIIV